MMKGQPDYGISSKNDALEQCTAAELIRALQTGREKSRMVEYAVVLDDGHENSHCYSSVPVSITDKHDIESFCAMQESGFSICLLDDPKEPQNKEQ